MFVSQQEVLLKSLKTGVLNKIQPINGILLNGVLIPNFLNNLLASWFLKNLDFCLPQVAQLDTRVNLICLVLLTLKFSFVVFFLQLI